ncbi:MAG TPA: transglycosylase domain-containing protein [Flavobacteriaceae bacterium]|nr:transglycosylase domain-containing protein [Flavobacteriaceae bacterium]
MSKKLKKNKLLRKWGVRLLLFVILIGAGFYGSVYFGVFGKIPSESELANLSQLQASRVYDKDENLIGKFFITDREAIDFEDFPTDLIQALIATEDARFYQHNGIDRQSVLRVLFKTILLQDKSSGGGSTLTLQLAKNIYGRRNYPFMTVVINKLRESIVARRLEKVYDKNEILTLYLNTVPFSGDTYGIESASQKFFGIKTKYLNLSQAALLVGTLKANHSYNPRLFPERSHLRRDVVLQQMVKYNYISLEEAEVAMSEKPEIDYQTFGSSTGPAPYFNEQVRRQVEKVLSDKRYRKPDGTPYKLRADGLKIHTTLDAKLQEYAQASVRDRMVELQESFEKSFGKNPPWRANSEIVQKAVAKLPTYKRLESKGLSKQEILDSLSIAKETELFGWKENQVKTVSTIDSLRHYMKFLNTGLVSVDPKSGAIRAYVGGIDYRYFQYDHVVQSKRQVGSTFKPFVYAAALENGLEPCDYFSGREVTYTDQKNWTPKNANNNVDPDLNYSLTEALTQSLNTISVKVLRDTGIQNVIDQVQQLGVTEKIENKPSIALGVSEIRLIEMAKAYTAFVNDGRSVSPFFLTRIEDKHGNLIVEFEPEPALPKAFSETTQQEMLVMMQNVVERGTAKRLRKVYHLQNDIAGKTGTTQENKDGWFVGLLPDLVTVTWVGNDNAQIKFPTTALGQGANSALPIFAGLLQKMNADPSFKGITTRQFEKPSPEVMTAMDCPPTDKDGFLKRLFTKDKVEKDFKKSSDKTGKKDNKKKRKGFFKRLFGGKK